MLDEKIITLNLRSRPLRLAYLVSDLDSLKDAVKLYTHTWGGAANVLLPVSDDEEKTKQLRSSLIKFDPEYILSTKSNDLPLGVKQILESLSVRHYPIQQECIYKFVDEEGSIYFHARDSSSFRRVRLPPIFPVLNSLYPGSMSDSGICILKSLLSEFEIELSLQAGITSQPYREGLNELPRRKRTGYQNQKRASCSSLCNLRYSLPWFLTYFAIMPSSPCFPTVLAK